jgi:uncharacterized protein YacL
MDSFHLGITLIEGAKMLEAIFEFIYEVLLEGVIELWTNFMKKRNPDYDNSRMKKVLTATIGVILMLVIAILFLAILFLIEWIFPNLFNIVEFD